MPKRGRRRKKARTHAALGQNETAQTALVSKADDKVPKSLVLRRGKTELEVGELVHDLRQLMLPYTAVNFQEDPKNRKLTLSQYAQHLALPLGVTHILSFSQREERLNMRLARTPEGPTLSFRVHRFSLNRHIKALQKRPVAFTPALDAHPPVVVTNNFMDSAAPHIKLMRITFQNLFPALNVATVKLRDCRRVVLFQYDPAAEVVHVRHYAITATPVGVHRRVRRLVQTNRKLPNLHNVQDIADFLQSGMISDAPSDSEADEDATHVKLSDNYSRGNRASQTSALKLVEMGPRLSLQLLKVVKGLGGGDVLYHALVHKTPKEAAAIKAKKEKERELKVQRRAHQEANVERKRVAVEEKRKTKRAKKDGSGRLPDDKEFEERDDDNHDSNDEDEAGDEMIPLK